MLTQDQSKNIAYVYDKLIKNETGTQNEWSAVDTVLEYVQWITDGELLTEAEILYSDHKNKNMGCPYLHRTENGCFIVNLLEAVKDILSLNEGFNYLDNYNKYILQYYIALYQIGAIVELMKP